MLTFHGKEEFKQELIGLARKHREQDEFIKGTYSDDEAESFRGCSVGCLINDINKKTGKTYEYSDHEKLAKELGWPEFVCRLQDSIFEGLPDPLFKEWTERLIEAIPVGKDISRALPKFLIKTVDRLPEKERRDVVESIAAVRKVLVEWDVTGTADVEAARSAESAAWSAESAAWEQIAQDLIDSIQEAA